MKNRLEIRSRIDPPCLLRDLAASPTREFESPVSQTDLHALLDGEQAVASVAASSLQVIDQLNLTNKRLSIATGEIRAILDALGAAIVVLDLDDHIEDCNPLALNWFFGDVDKHQIIGRTAQEVCTCASDLADARSRADGSSQVLCIHGRDMQVVVNRILDDMGGHAKTVMLFTDISQQKASERHLRLYSEVFRHVGEGIMITDARNRIVEVNEAVTRITGHAPGELIGCHPSVLQSGLHDAAFFADIDATLQERGYWQGEIHARSRDGQVIPLLASISQVRDEAGSLQHHIGVMTDISFLKEAQVRLDFLAHHDVLTELPNRLLFNDRLRHAIELARRDGRLLALLFIDLDRFKTINDSLGHHIGDQLLIQAAKRLLSLVRSSDTLARLGGDEFVVLMQTGASHATAAQLAHKIIAGFKQPFSIDGKELHIGCSIGITLFPEDGTDADTLLKHADVAMYRAKEAGRDGHVRYSLELSLAMSQKLELESALRGAVQEEAFELHYQPLIDIQQNRLVACEALIRWPQGPESCRSPERFIPVAEEMRLIVPLGEWVLRQALHHKRAWRQAGLQLDYVSVNISAVQLAQPDFSSRVIALLQEADVAGSELQIELTENVLMGDIELCARVLAELRQQGIRVAIDDFGTGYSSLSYLKRLPIDNLKIDRSFVRDIPEDGNDCAIATAIIGLAQTLGLQAVAEGIETPAQQDYLARIGCSLVQGYLHARPMPAGEFAAYARQRVPV